MKRSFVCVFFIFTALPFFLTAQEGGQRPKIAVIRVKNEFDNTAYEAICDTVSDTVEITLRLMDRYRIERTDYINPYEEFSKAKIFFSDYNFDNAIFGRVFSGEEGNIVLSMSVFDRLEDRVTIEEKVSVQSLMDVFEASDELTAAVVEAFSGEHIGFGVLTFSGEGEIGDVAVYVDGEYAGLNPTQLTVLQGTRMVEIRQKLEEGERLLKREEVEIVENEEAGISFSLESVQPVEEPGPVAEKEEPPEPVQEEIPEEPLPEKPVPDKDAPTKMIFDEEDNVLFKRKVFFPNVLHDYEELFVEMEKLPAISEVLRLNIDEYTAKIKRNKTGFFIGLGVTGGMILPLYIGVTGLAASSISGASSTDTFITLSIASGAGLAAGLIAAGITGAVLFTAKPVEVVNQYNRDYGF